MSDDRPIPNLRKPPNSGLAWLWMVVPGTLGGVLLVLGGLGVLTVVACIGLLFAAFTRVEKKGLDDLDPGFTVEEFTHAGKICSLEFSPDGKHLAAGSFGVNQAIMHDVEGNLIVWEVASGKEIHAEVFSQWVIGLAFHPKGTHLAVCSSAGPRMFHNVPVNDRPPLPTEVHLFEFPTMRLVKLLKLDGRADDVLFSPDGKTLAISHDDGVLLNDFPSLDERAIVKESVPRTKFAFSPDSKKILAGVFRAPIVKNDPNQRTEIAIFDAFTGTQEAILGGGNWPPSRMQMTSDGLLLVGQIFYDYGKDRAAPEVFPLVRIPRKPNSQLNFVTVSADNQRLLATEFSTIRRGSTKSTVLLWEGDQAERKIFHDSDVRFERCTFSPDSKQFAVGTSPYIGIRGKQGDPKNGRVLLFQPK